MCFIGVGSGSLVGEGLMFAHIMIPLDVGLLFWVLSNLFVPLFFLVVLFLFIFFVILVLFFQSMKGGGTKQPVGKCATEEEDKGVYIYFYISAREWCIFVEDKALRRFFCCR